MIDLVFIKNVVPQLLTSALVTLQITFFASIIGFLGGTLLGIAQSGTSKILRIIVATYTTIIRGTPVILQIMFAFLCFLSLGINISALQIAILALGINSSAYISQIVRSGISSVPHGQVEAGTTLGLSRYAITRYIVLPQALRVVVPALGNEFITLIKESSLAFTIGVVELYMRGNIIITQAYNALMVYTLVGLIYLGMTSLISVIFLKIEHSLRRPHARN